MMSFIDFGNDSHGHTRDTGLRERHDPLDVIPPLTTPGLFITATDTGVGKTVVTCAVADILARLGMKVGVLKPFATGAKYMREGLVSDDAMALAYFAQFDHAIGGLSVINPLVYKAPAAPAVAMELERRTLDTEPIGRSLRLMNEHCDVILVEGVGGVLVPLDAHNPQLTVLDVIGRIGYPVVVVTRASLGTLNHTALTVAVLKARQCRVAGLVVNFYNPDDPDPAMQTNHDWLGRMNRVPILATIPALDPQKMAVSDGLLHDEARAAVALMDWRSVIGPSRPVSHDDRE